VLALLPFIDVTVPDLFTGPLSSPGTLQIIAVGLVFAGVAMSYDLLLGYTGLLSLGHALYFALGVYGTNLLMVHLEWSYLVAVPVAILGTGLVACLVGSVALRVRGVAFAMVTLAFAEAFHVFVEADPARISGGEEGLSLASSQVPGLPPRNPARASHRGALRRARYPASRGRSPLRRRSSRCRATTAAATPSPGLCRPGPVAGSTTA
jgi:branched-chain amino acid transport system permease protein